MTKMNSNKLNRLFPNASKSFVKLNKDSVDGLYPDNEKSVEGGSLDSSLPREAKSGNRFKIVFTVFSVIPADWDAYDIKSMQDLVVKSGILPNDDWFTLRGEVIPEKVYKKEDERTEIEIFQL